MFIPIKHIWGLLIRSVQGFLEKRLTIWPKILWDGKPERLPDMFSAEESQVSHPAHANENLQVIRKFDVLFLLAGMDGMDSAFG